ncbi:MAG: DUF4126 domain-containing protein [Acidobacteriota bacterium]
MVEALTSLATSAGLGIGAGINAYATFLAFGLLSRNFPDLFKGDLATFFSSTPALILFGILYTIEFLADKIPAVDHVWDIIHTFVRPVAGALVALAAAHPGVPRGVVITSAILGGGMALGSHLTKASLRAASTATTAGIANPILSIGEDIFAFAGSAMAIFVPFLFLALLLLVIIPVVYLVRLAFRRRSRAAVS